jgi:hypothetical protein
MTGCGGTPAGSSNAGDQLSSMHRGAQTVIRSSLQGRDTILRACSRHNGDQRYARRNFTKGLTDARCLRCRNYDHLGTKDAEKPDRSLRRMDDQNIVSLALQGTDQFRLPTLVYDQDLHGVSGPGLGVKIGVVTFGHNSVSPV